MTELHEIKPREQAGRDTFERFRAQVRAAGIACLFILEGKEIDAVFCDYHDDFVIRKNSNGDISYNFVQVKTKGKENYQWKLNDTLGIPQKTQKQSSVKTEKVKNSFIGKLLVHTVTFDKACEKATFMTNIHLHDELDEFRLNIENKEFNNKHVKFLIYSFNDCFASENKTFSKSEIRGLIAKLDFDSDVQYIKMKNDNFEAIAKEKIYRYSEIDLTYGQSKKILLELLELIAKKSSKRIDDNITAEKLTDAAGIRIDDILEILSLSKNAYYSILSGDKEQNALKTTSIIQRALENAGANRDIVDFCAQCKTDWDIWLRNRRTFLNELDIQKITYCFDKFLKDEITTNNAIDFGQLTDQVDKLKTEFKEKNILYNLEERHILGGILASLVRYNS